MHFSRKVTAALLALASIALAPQKAAAQQSARDLYRDALAHMVSLPEPSLVSYRATVSAHDASFLVARDPATSQAQFGFSLGDALGDDSVSWPVIVRARDVTTAVNLGDGFALSRFPIFDATWFGAYDWLRYGFDGRPLDASVQTPSPLPMPTSGETAPPLISVVQAIGIGAYRVEDRGEAKCPQGDDAQRMRLIPLDDADRHPATDVIVDRVSPRICSMRFDLRTSQFWTLSGSVELHFADVSGYELVSDGVLTFNTRMRGIGKRRVTMYMHYDRFAFPADAPADLPGQHS